MATAFPADLHELLALGHARLLDHQGAAYARLYLQRLQAVLQAEQARGPLPEHPVTREAARWLALWMAYEDIVRVADLKSRASRMARVRQEVKAGAHDLVKLYDHFKPGVPELAAVLPTALAQPLWRWERRRVARGLAPWALPIQVATHSITGLAMLRLLAALRWLRPWSSRYRDEQAQMTQWLQALVQALHRSPALGLEVARCGQLIKGYGSTHERSRRNLQHILTHGLAQDPDRPDPAQADAQAQAIAHWRQAALQDEAGQALDQALRAHGAPARPVAEQPIVWMKNPRTGRA